jgi:beta-lactam-binding protein with PASTA domain
VAAAAAIAVPVAVIGDGHGTAVRPVERSAPPLAQRSAATRVIPRTVGLNVRAAVAVLRAALLTAQIIIEHVPAGQPAGTVVAQLPAAGARVAAGAAITLVLSAGKPRA